MPSKQGIGDNQSMSTGYTRDSQEWLPDREIELLNMERATEPELTDATHARKILSDAAPKAARAIAWMAVNSANESIRLRAAQYVIDGVVGGNFKAEGGEDDILLALVNQLQENDGKPQPGRIY